MSTVILILIASGVLALDQATKFWAQTDLATRGSLPVIPRIFHLTLVHNQGAAFGLWQGGVFFLMAVAVVCGIAIVLMLIRRDLFARILGLDPDDPRTRLALALILAGAIGNMVDRMRFGYVIDFFDFRVWPVFNVADSAITIGAVLIGLSILGHRSPRKENATHPV